MLIVPRHDMRWSAIATIKQWWRNRLTLNADFAGEKELSRVAVDLAMSTAERQRVVGLGGGRFDLLLIRMEALHLQPCEVKRIESTVFCDLVDACANCQSKDKCERDLAYEWAGTVTDDWENYCPNAATLNAMKALPWFGNQK